MRKKRRLDLLLVERGLVDSRESAKRRILAGEVRVDGRTIAKPGTQVPDDATVELTGKPERYVSRGGYKLERALEVFRLDVRDRVVLDAGASTGGFTDCLIQHGARLVYAVDVGYGQLAWKLRQDPRVRPIERTNIRHVTLGMFDPPPEMATADLAFIGLSLVMPVFARLLPEGGLFFPLIKPQFEAGREFVERGGVVTRPEVHRQVLLKVAQRGLEVGLVPLAATYSPLRGPAGNLEFFLLFRKEATEEKALAEPLRSQIEETVQEAHRTLKP
ncbi:MAG: TlyA family rRNA (cytidine-2'-O)-methyltransferase [Candidatus Poribacteria bacterium]|nr:MAG: TlyA family rRNA (cytidine-2'-O)-methyltransferase [Candidatus Poribacteria bacterium]